VALEWIVLDATLAVSRRALETLPEIRADFLLERLLRGALGAAAFLLVLGTLTTAVSMLFLSEEMALRITLPIPHRALLRRQIALTILAAAAPTILLALPAVLLAFREAGLAASATLLLSVLFVVALAGLVGVTLALLLVRAVPPRRARLLSAAISALGLAAALVGFRTARPERALDPMAAVDLLRSLSTTPPEAPGGNPVSWAAHAATAAICGRPNGALVAMALVLAAVALLQALSAALAPLHLRLWESARSQAEEGSSRPRRSRSPAVSLGRELIAAEARTFLRDASTPAQLGSLAAVFVLDLLNVRLLPSTDPASRDLVAGLQTALALFLVSALALRFAYPAVSVDGRSALVLRTLPLSPVPHLMCRYAVRGLPAVLLALVLVVASDLALSPGRQAVFVSIVAAVIGGLAIPALHLGLGALFPRYGSANAISVALGPGGLAALALSTVFSLTAALAVSGELRVLASTLLSTRLEAMPVLAIWSAGIVVSAFVPMALAARSLVRADIAGS
jgi:ABC-2 type transport system permease protein